MIIENIALFKEELDEFHQLYADRPIANNEGGMKSPHLFATFHTLRKLRPLLIIESGVWKGQGTWLMKKALPEVNILSFDVDFGNLVYKHPEVNYVQNDIKNIPWNKMYEDNPKITPENTLLFLDDHQNFIERLVFLKNSPFKHIMFEDNYPSNQGDCLSPKKIKAGRVVEDFVNLMDLAPTFCEAGQIKVPECMVGKSILPLFTSDIQHGQIEENRNFVVMGRERHGK